MPERLSAAVAKRVVRRALTYFGKARALSDDDALLVGQAGEYLDSLAADLEAAQTRVKALEAVAAQVKRIPRRRDDSPELNTARNNALATLAVPTEEADRD